MADIDIFDDLIKYNYIYKCTKCNKYVETVGNTEYEKEYPGVCNNCGDDKWEAEND